jgi:hypothetical protein
MPFLTRRQRRKQNAGGWTQGPPLSSDQYYLSEYRGYDDCYAMARPGSIQSNPNPDLAQTAMAGGARRRQRGGNSCAEYFRTRGGSRRQQKKRGGCGCLLRGGSSGSTKRKQRGGRYGFDVSESVGGDGPNVNPVVSSVPCEAYRPMSINPHVPTDLVSGPDPDLQFAGLRPASVMMGGKRSRRSKRSQKKW